MGLSQEFHNNTQNGSFPVLPIVKYNKWFPDTLIYKKHTLDCCDDLTSCSDIRVEGDNIIYTLQFRTEIPAGYAIDVFPRSSIRKYDLLLCNSVGIVDSPYRNSYEVSFKIVTSNIGKLLRLQWLKWIGKYDYWNIKRIVKVYNVRDKICQVRLHKIVNFKWEEVMEIDKSIDRGGGHGSTGS